jgi:hypothetical protein
MWKRDCKETTVKLNRRTRVLLLGCAVAAATGGALLASFAFPMDGADLSVVGGKTSHRDDSAGPVDPESQPPAWTFYRASWQVLFDGARR